jgi:hypothetical protein
MSPHSGQKTGRVVCEFMIFSFPYIHILAHPSDKSKAKRTQIYSLNVLSFSDEYVVRISTVVRFGRAPDYRE